MRGIKIALVAIFLLGTSRAFVTDSFGYPPLLKKAKKFGAKDCTFCHVSADGGEPFNDRGKWLITEKQRRNADVVDTEWLAEYQASGADRKNTPERELNARLTAWFEAAKKHDQNKLKQIVADEFMGTDESGQLKKAEYISGVAGLKIESYRFHDVTTRLYGDDMAVVGFRLVIKGSKQGKDISGEYRHTDVWIKKDGQWQVAAVHASRITKP